ncbi:MAG TPA: ankyrin repeat domain-containing protein [Vicinamibacterales bacterium]|nr:ankyrin repeat domain-containing protein [Vicinamibacterales bacterium]
MAIRTGDAAAVERALAIDPSAAHARDGEGRTPVLFAAYMRQGEPLAALLAHIGDLDVFEAAAVGREVRLGALLAADPSLVRAYSADGFTALHLACFFSHDAAARILLDHGADPDAVARNEMRVTPLHSAVAARSHAAVGALLAAGADPNTSQQGGWTALHAAAQHGDRSLVDLLLSAGADASIANDDDMTAADIATDTGHDAIAELLRG